MSADRKKSNLGEAENRYRRVVRFSRWLVLILNLVLAVALVLITIRVVPFARNALTGSATSLRSFSESIDRVSVILDASTRTLQTTSDGLLDTSRSIEKSTVVLDSAAGVVTDIEEVVIEQSLVALSRVGSAAGEIDRTIQILAFLGLVDRESDDRGSLESSIGELITVLETWPGELSVLSGSLEEITTDVDDISTALGEIRGDLEIFQSEVELLAVQVEGISSDLDQTADNLDRWAERLPYVAWILVGALELLLAVNIFSALAELLQRPE